MHYYTMDEEGRKQCRFCGEVLAHSAYYRHLNDENGVVCPGRLRYESDHSSDFNFDNARSSENSWHDSSFDFGSEPEDSCVHHALNDATVDIFDEEMEVSDSDSVVSFKFSVSDEEEIWSDSDDEPKSGCTTSAEGILSGIFLFLNFFQLFYRVSERAMMALLGFFHILFAYLASMSQNSDLTELSSKFPKSLYSIRKHFQISNGDITEYVVCQKCCTLYSLDDCIVTRQGRAESKLCSYVEFPNHPHMSKRNKCGMVLMKQIRVGKKSKCVPRKNFYVL